MNIGDKLRKARQALGQTQEQVAQAVGVSRQTISNWETGRSLAGRAQRYPPQRPVRRQSRPAAEGDDTMLHHIEESTNTVKSRSAWPSCWRFCPSWWSGRCALPCSGWAAAATPWLQHRGDVPSAACYHLRVRPAHGPGHVLAGAAVAVPVVLRVGYVLLPYGTFSTANMLTTGTFRLPEWQYILYGTAFAMQGLCLGSAHPLGPGPAPVAWGTNAAPCGCSASCGGAPPSSCSA